MDLSAFLLRMAQEAGFGSLDAIAVEEPMVPKGARRIVLGLRASYFWEGERVSSSLQMAVSAWFLKPCVIDVELYLLTNLVSRGSHPHQG